MNLSNENVIHVKKNGIEYLQFRKLLEYEEKISHAYTLGLNLNFRTATAGKNELPKEELEKALSNYNKVCNCINIGYNNLVKTSQEHTKNVIIVNKKINKDKPDFNLEEYANTDGLITNTANIGLCTTNADCILFLFYDPVNGIIANIHSGWRGTLQEISTVVIDKMVSKYNSVPSDIICCICPSIRQCHFEVENDVKTLFFNKFKSLKEIDQIIKHNEVKNKWNIDTVLINKVILQKQGLKPENIIDSGICSVCNSKLVHSYRAEGNGFGLATAIIALK